LAVKVGIGILGHWWSFGLCECAFVGTIGMYFMDWQWKVSGIVVVSIWIEIVMDRMVSED
jgi:hypothetical protein